MASIQQALQQIARERRNDPLAPVTVIAPSHAAAIQLRRRLSELCPQGAFAGVRFETLPRLAELIAGGELARRGLRPLARPIADYLALEVARTSGPPLDSVAELPGYARVLRQTFRRLRRGGIRRSEQVRALLGSPALAEVLNLYGRFRQRSSSFYDEEDLFEAAAELVRDGTRPSLDPGRIYLLPPGALSAGADAFIKALRRGSSGLVIVSDDVSSARSSFVLASDPASEAREVAREVIRALEDGLSLGEVAVFHGSEAAYPRLLRSALESAGIPVTLLPGLPQSESAAGRCLLSLLALPVEDYARTAIFDFLGYSPLKGELPGVDGPVRPLTHAWRRLAAEAGVTRSLRRWRQSLQTLIEDLNLEEASAGRELSEERRGFYEWQAEQAAALLSFVEALVARLEPLRERQSAASFIRAFRAVAEEYLAEDVAGREEVLAQIDQLGTVDSVGGQFSLESFAAALRANLDAAYTRERGLGEGVLVAPYTAAAGLRFRRVIVCGAGEGLFPAATPLEGLVDAAAWSELARQFPFIEDRTRQQARALEAAQRALSAAGETLVWTAPLQDGSAGRDLYPSHLMVAAARQRFSDLDSASALRRAASRPGLRRASSPLATRLTGAPLDRAELRLRTTLLSRREGRVLPPDHPIAPALRMLRARRSSSFSAFDGNLGDLAGDALVPRATVSPTALEHYAACGFRYFLRSVLGVRAPEQPAEAETMEPTERGSLVHDVLNRFFSEEQARGRPRPGERWSATDRERLLWLLDERLAELEKRGRTGMGVFSEFQRRSLQDDLSAFLEKDNEFRQETGAVPYAFELAIEREMAGLRLYGFVDRIDRTPDGRRAWVIDYKTGSAESFGSLKPDDPLAGGTRLQLPVYLEAVRDAEQAASLYWFISRRGGYEKVSFEAKQENLQLFERTLAAMLDAVKQGVFPAVPGDWDDFYSTFANCRYCDYNRICSRRRDQEFQEKSGDAALEPWLRIAAVAKGEAQ